MPVFVTVEIKNSVLSRILRSPSGPVARDMRARGERVKLAAQRRINSRSGRLASSIEVQITVSRGAVGSQVGTSLYYAKFVHDGTGIYGPQGRPIQVPRGKVMKFGGGTNTTYVRTINGQRPQQFLLHALRAAK